MSTILHPVGPQRARVYWVRRLLVVLVVAALAATAVTWLRGGGEEPAAAAAGDTTASARGAGGSGAEPADGDTTGDGTVEDAGDVPDETDRGDDGAAPTTPVACTPEAVQLTLTSSAVEFDATTEPVLTATVTNVGDVPCTVDAGDVTREVVITSGDDRIWSTKDCATEDSASRQLLLDAGAADAAEIAWPRVRSAQGCPADLPAPREGTYQAVATLGATTSQTVVFILG